MNKSVCIISLLALQACAIPQKHPCLVVETQGQFVNTSEGVQITSTKIHAVICPAYAPVKDNTAGLFPASYLPEDYK